MIKNVKICVVGMGYVGLPLAIAFAEKDFDVIGFDLNQEKIDKYLQGIDPTNEVGNEKIKTVKNLKFTSNEKDISESFYNCSSTNSCFR